MKFYLGVTDNRWFDFLSRQVPVPEDVNFWRPMDRSNFWSLSAGGPFLFKLKKTGHPIGGIGFFTAHSVLPLTVAWDTFRERNGASSLKEFRALIESNRSYNWSPNPAIGCIALSNPIFFDAEDWIYLNDAWRPQIIQGKSFDTSSDPAARVLWLRVEALLLKYLRAHPADAAAEVPIEWLVRESEPQYREVLSKVRVGQGAFRVLVTDAYRRRCAITGEKTLPVLEAAHIKPYAEAGPHLLSNGILLRSDMHKLFDTGYVTVTRDLRVEVSGRIKEEFENGREYYRFHGERLAFLPEKETEHPDTAFLDWHNTNLFKA